MINKWNDNELTYIIDNYESKTDTEIAKALNRTTSSVASKRKKLGLIRSNRKYTFDDVINEFAKTDYELISTKDDYYDSAQSTLKYICPRHREEGVLTISLNHLQRGRGCKYCGIERSAKKRMVDLDFNEAKELCEKNNFTFCDLKRINGLISVVFICNNHFDLGEQSMPIGNIRRDIKGCKYCAGKELPSWYVLNVKEIINPDVELLEEYQSLTAKIKCRCKEHGIVSYKTMQNILKGNGCDQCGLEKLSQQKTINLEQYKELLIQNDRTVDVLTFNGLKEHAEFKCKKCGHTWWSSASYMCYYGKQCPNCEHFYYGENAIANILSSWNIPFESQKRFDECKDKRALPFDFFLPDYNICIEYDGLQHFEQREGWTDLIKIRYHDSIKNKYCSDNKITLIRISCFDKDIKSLLFERLSLAGVFKMIA